MKATAQYRADEIIEAVSRYFQLRDGQIKGARGSHYVSTARHYAFYLLDTHLNLSYADIGRLFGRDHTSVMYGVRRIAEQRRLYDEMNNELLRLEAIIGEGVEASKEREREFLRAELNKLLERAEAIKERIEMI